MTIGEKLKSLRLGTKRTLKQQSMVFNVSTNSVYRWEHDLATPRMSMLKKIADFYEVPFSWLVSEQVVDETHDLNGNKMLSNGTDQQFVKLFRKLPIQSRYKAIGYLDRLYHEYMDSYIPTENGEVEAE